MTERTPETVLEDRRRGNREPDFAPDETLVGQPVADVNDWKDAIRTTVSPYAGSDLVQELLITLLVARKNWEASPDDASKWQAFIDVQGEIYARLKRDIETNGNSDLTAWYETAQGWV